MCGTTASVALVIGEQLCALASSQAAAARRTHKHAPLAQRGVASDEAWWGCLLEALGLPSVR